MGISIPKSDETDNFNIQKLFVKKSACFKCTYRLSGNDYKVPVYQISKHEKRNLFLLLFDSFETNFVNPY